MIYQRPPILEAVIDLQVTLPVGTNPPDLREFTHQAGDRFKTAEPIVPAAPPADPSVDPQPPAVQEPIAYRLTADGGRTVTVSHNRITFAQSKPYTNWETFSSDARAIWQEYRSAVGFETVHRAGIRYINMLSIPADQPIERYLQLRPALPSGFKTADLRGFFVQLQVPQPELGGLAVINLFRSGTEERNRISILLDIDIFAERVWQGSDDEGLWGFLATLRDRKNEIFEASITDDMRALFEPTN